MDLETIRRISLARHLYALGADNLRSRNDLHLFAAVNLLQDAVEAFLVAIADHVKAPVDQNTKFDKYFSLIDERIAPKELPFRNKLLRLNRIRVDSKHHGIQPARDECDRVAVSVREFFDEASTSVLGVEFATVSTIDLLEDGEIKELLIDAKEAMERGDTPECLISCRKVIYLAFEQHYDIASFGEEPGQNALIGLLGPYSKAPYHARNKQFIDESVTNATDFIVLDHTALDQELLIQGVDNTAFWNIWRLTPDVYRRKDKEWVVKQDFDKLAADTADYVFPATIDIAFAVQAHKRSVQVPKWGKHRLTLKREGVSVYQKADVTSPVLETIEGGELTFNTNFSVPGLKGDGVYWHISAFGRGRFTMGYVHDDDVESASSV